MKTLKKSLCLILALVFVLGLCTFGAGAAFTDDADIEYKDAVKVMEALKILEGPGDGSFQPKENVTRAQAAKMIAYMMLGEEAAKKLPAASTFADVPVNEWYAPLVNFCATKGIIKGYGDGNFGPNDDVTGLQLAKMLLVACGYGEMNEFAPDTWEINTFTYAVEQDIFEDAEVVDFSAPATREECALYVYNTLTGVTMVKYDVDMNNYDNKTYAVYTTDNTGKREAIYYNETFGHKIWKLIDTENSSMYCYVVGTIETGWDYNTVEISDYKGAPQSYYYYFSNDIDKELIGHQVEICFNTVGEKDAKGNYIYDAYLIEDESTTVESSGLKVGELTAALGKDAGPIAEYVYNSDGTKQFYTTNPTVGTDHYDAVWNAEFALMKNPGFRYFEDYTEKYDFTDLFASFVGYAKPHWDASTFTYIPTEGANGYFHGTNFYIRENLKRNTESFGGTGVFVLDEFGDVISYIENGSYTVAVVDAVEDGYIVVSNYGDFDGEEIENEYVKVEGLEEGDYVTVDYVGDNYIVTGTSTKTSAVSAKSASIFGGWDFNYGAMFGGFGASRGYGMVKIEDADDPELVTPGSTVTFYLDSHGSYFGLVIDESATDYGYVFFVDTYEPSVLEDGDVVKVTKALCVDANGNSVSYLLNTNAKDYKAPVKENVYKVTMDKDGYATLTATPECVKVTETTKGFGMDKRIGAYYLADDTQVFYVKPGTKANTVTVVESTVLPKGSNNFFFYLNAEEDAPVVWLYDVNSPATTASYMFVVAMDKETYANNKAGGETVVNGTPVCYFTTYIEGATTLANIYSVDKTVLEYVANTTAINPGFYRYSIDANGIYYLESPDAGEVKNSVVLTKNNLHKGIYTTDNVDLNDAVFYDVSDYTNNKGYRANISTLDQLIAVLEKGYQVTVSFPYIDTLDGAEPAGTVYITNVSK